jgi:hypothetical protein
MTPSKRISSDRLNIRFNWLLLGYCAFAALVAYIAYVVGQFVPLPLSRGCGGSATNASELHLGCILASVDARVMRLAVLALFTYPVLVLVCWLTGWKTIRELIGDMRSKDNNDSPAILVLGIGAAIGVAAVFLPYSDIGNFLVNFGLRIGFIAIVALVLTIVLMRLLFKLRTYGQYVAAINESGTNALALWTIAVYIATAFIVCGPS